MTDADSSARKYKTQLIAFLLLYGCVLLSLLSHLPLWLDEIAEMNVLVQPDLGSLIGELKSMTGGTPLPFLISSWTVMLLGKTAFAARLWSAIASLGACAGIYPLAARFGMRQPLIAVLVFAVCPLQFRYALEARPYALPLALSIWCSVVFLNMVDASRTGPEHSGQFRQRALLYVGLVVVAASTMVYAAFLAVAHGVWLLATRAGRAVPSRVLYVTIVGLILAALSLVPWYLLFRADWAINSQRQHVTPVTLRAMGIVLHELTGAGYVGTVLLAAGVGCALWRRDREPGDHTGFHLVCAVIPALLVPVADVVFYYFFAVRQMIFVLAPLSVLFAAGVQRALGSAKCLMQILSCATLATFLYADFNWMTRPHEDWDAAGAAALQQVRDGTACVILIPEVKGSPFLFAHPQLAARSCAAEPTGPVVLAVSQYDSDAVYLSAVAQLRRRGYAKQSEQSFAGPRVELFVRP